MWGVKTIENALWKWEKSKGMGWEGQAGKENEERKITHQILHELFSSHLTELTAHISAAACAFFICWVLTLKLLHCCIHREKPKWSEFMQSVHGHCIVQGALTHTFIGSSFFDKLLHIKSICRLSFSAPLCGWINFWSFWKKPIPSELLIRSPYSVDAFIRILIPQTHCMGIFRADRYRLPFRCTCCCWCCFSCTLFST